MSEKRKPQRAFLTVTLMTVLAVTMVFMVYAALLASYTGSDVIISSMGGSVEYSLSNADPWTTSSISQGEGAQWYTRIYLTTPPSQDVTANFVLQKQVGTDWTTTPPTNVTSFTTNTITLTTSTHEIYACSDGFTVANNLNWGPDTTTAGTYRIVAEINTAP